MVPPRLLAIQDGRDRTIVGRLGRGLLCILEALYRAVISKRNRAYDQHSRRVTPLGVSAISVGNLTTGGTGKTPMVIRLVEDLLAQGFRPAILLRGYRGQQITPSSANEAPPPPRYRSDEADLYAHHFGDRVPVAADPDRARSARYLLHHFPEVDVLVLDDAFQHRKVHRDIDLVLVDATQELASARLLPRGMLREPPASLARATAVIITRADRISPTGLAHLQDDIEALHGKPAIATSIHAWDHFTDARGTQHPLSSLADRRVIGVCGIGNPNAFFSELAERSAEIVAEHRMSDHHAYTAEQIEPWFDEASKQRAILVTTAKDWTKWQALLTRRDVEVWVPQVRIKFTSGEEAVQALLGGLARRGPQSPGDSGP